ncbi:MAG: antibiotic biosynthesis monooxygenase family protein [Pseudomonadota bacterium]
MPDHSPMAGSSLTRRTAFAALAGSLAATEFLATPAIAQSAIAGTGGYLIVAQWEAKEGQADAVADILRRYLPQAQSDPGVKLFLIARAKDDPAQFLFYELFVDEAASKAHQASSYFQALIAGQALALLSKRERTQFTLL